MVIMSSIFVFDIIAGPMKGVCIQFVVKVRLRMGPFDPPYFRVIDMSAMDIRVRQRLMTTKLAMSRRGFLRILLPLQVEIVNPAYTSEVQNFCQTHKTEAESKKQ